MDLSFSRFEPDSQATSLPADLAVLMVGVSARQAASPTAILHARLTPIVIPTSRFAPADGAFNGAVAAMFIRWEADEGDVYLATLTALQSQCGNPVLTREGAPRPDRG
ncbi:hypothetical protein EWE75_16830 [Sphingomonas populi]|uniref:Uncharacterized protein n=1 Tax=Sphingomonas populi TaxID=2484750 RepID=A0A4Q6XTP4_9SPHN|nr:hypothetical protein [Sphingomonas populi]RZF63331.1 hypothetical protein EWE75_16830 [Sphingomonas populi]